MSDLILVQEALQEARIAEIAEMIAADPDKRIVLIAGPSSSGKTTFFTQVIHTAARPWAEAPSHSGG